MEGGTWQSNGATVSGLTVGNHPLAFSTVSGYTTPSGFTVQIVSGTTTSALGLYTLIPQYTITVSASPSAGGTVSGGGTFASGSSWTVTATANSGYTFANWTENSSVVSSSASYNFTLSGNRTLVANFTVNPVSHSPMTVDLNNDGIPNFYDFSIFAKFWQNASCSEPNWCNGSDFNHDGVVDFKDLQIFSEFWLWPVADVDMDSKVNFADYVLFSKRWKQTGCKYPDWCNGCDFDKNGQIDILDLMIFAEWWLEGTRFQLWSVADLDMNGKVNFVDYTLFSSHWKQTACESPDWCYGCDFDKSGTVDILDFAIFADHWLEGTSP